MKENIKLHLASIIKVVFLGIVFLIGMDSTAQTVLYTEDFEGTVGTTYTINPAFDEDLSSGSFILEEQWMNGAVISTGDGPYFTGESGSKIIYAKELASIANAVNGNEAQLTTSAIDITGYTDLELSFLFAAHIVDPPGLKLFEGPAETGATTAQDLVTVEYKIGSGAWTKLMEFTGRDCDDNDDDAGNLYRDTDLDGTGSYECSVAAAQVSTTFTTFSETFTNSGGTSLNVRFRFISDDFQEGYALDLVKVSAADIGPPTVQSIAPTGSPAANASSMNFLVTFDEIASAVSADDFTLTKTSTANGTIGVPSTSDGGTTWTVPVSSITGDGTLRLDLNASTNVVDASGNGNGTNGHVAAFSSGTAHTVDLVVPTVTSIVRSSPVSATTNATSVTFRVTFSENVSNITIADFAISGAGAGGTATLSGFSTFTPSTVFDLTVSSLNTDGELDLDFSGAEDITDSNGNDFAQTISSEENYTMAFAPSSVTMEITVFLEGAYNGSGLNNSINGSIPAQQPYNGTNSHSETTNVTSMPANAVDWVLVELREAGSAADALNNTKVGSAAGLLMSDGSIKATNGSSNLDIALSGNTGANFFVVIYHRNHLPIMSAAAVSESSGTYTLDFTSNSANTYQNTTALASLSGSKFGMPAGDLNQDGDIDATDLSTWRTNNGTSFSYSSNGAADFNLDGVINAVDRNEFHQKNTSKTRQVPSS